MLTTKTKGGLELCAGGLFSIFFWTLKLLVWLAKNANFQKQPKVLRKLERFVNAFYLKVIWIVTVCNTFVAFFDMQSEQEKVLVHFFFFCGKIKNARPLTLNLALWDKNWRKSNICTQT